MAQNLSLDELWAAAPAARGAFRPEEIAHLPPVARRYLAHAIAPGTPLASAVRLRMHGEIKLQGWFPFTAEQVIVWGQGFIWQATVRTFGLPIKGSDRLVDGQAAMRWRLLGQIPVVTAAGPDIARSAAGRVAGEAMWLPSVLCDQGVAWTTGDEFQAQATFTAHGETSTVAIAIDEVGRVERTQLQRWGNPADGAFTYHAFGAIAEEERKFEGYTIPTRLRAGWYFGTERYEAEGEFFRATIDEAIYR
jgi:hypothetical protein